MKPRSILLLAWWLTFWVAAAAPARPNVVIFLADDAGWGDYSHSGNTQLRTPHIDSLAGKVAPGWDPPLYTNQDTLPRPTGESQMKEFRTLAPGKITLPAGQSPLILHSLEIPGKSVMDVRRITLTLLD